MDEINNLLKPTKFVFGMIALGVAVAIGMDLIHVMSDVRALLVGGLMAWGCASCGFDYMDTREGMRGLTAYVAKLNLPSFSTMLEEHVVGTMGEFIGVEDKIPPPQ